MYSCLSVEDGNPNIRVIHTFLRFFDIFQIYIGILNFIYFLNNFLIKLTLLLEISPIFVDDCPPSFHQGTDAVTIEVQGFRFKNVQKFKKGRI